MTRTEGTEPGWVDRSLAELARAAAARGPVPGSGGVAAAIGALGAGLASMALGSARGESSGAAAELVRDMEGLLARVDRDVAAYTSYLEARNGRGELQAAVEGAIAVPREVAEHALAALERLAARLADVRPHLHSEALTAAQALLACVEGATFTARSNLPGLADPSGRDERSAALAGLAARARELARQVHEHVQHPAR
jgi:formiminotetrahydrofolate cyclodeaminase